MTSMNEQSKMQHNEFSPKTFNGFAMLFLNTLLMIAAIAIFVLGIIYLESSDNPVTALGVLMIASGSIVGFLVSPTVYCGLKVINPNEALVLTLFGKYYGTLRKEGFYFVNPFVTAINPTIATNQPTNLSVSKENNLNFSLSSSSGASKKISLKAMTLNNEKQKINDQLGNPIVIGIVVIWKVVNTAKAVFNVDNYKEYLSMQTDSALRNIVRLYPYDSSGDDNEKTLRGSSQDVANKIKEEIQAKVELAGLEIVEARITHLSYAQEIAAAMLQRQQASAIIDARQMIVEGAVGMVEMALHKLNENDIVHLDEERKAAMVSNLLVVLCANKEAQPIVNSGSLY